MGPPNPADGLVDLDLLDAYLVSDKAPDNCMGLSDLDGFLTGIVVGPELIMPSEWLPFVWGHGEPRFDDIDEAEAVIGTIVGRYNEIIFHLGQTPPIVDPVFWEGPGRQIIVADWCAGFVEGMKLRSVLWAKLIRDKHSAELLRPIIGLGADPEDYKLLGIAINRPTGRALHQLLQDARDLIPISILGVQHYWQARRKEPHTPGDQHTRH